MSVEKNLTTKMLASKNILKEEQDLIKLNEEIDQKTKDLLAQVEQIKKMQSSNDMQSILDKNQQSDTDFAIKEYLTRVQNNDSQSEDQSVGKTKKSKLSLVSAKEQELAISLGITRHKSDMRMKSSYADNNVIPETLKGVGHDGIVRFLSAKVKLLTERLEIMRKDEKTHLDKIKELQTYKDKSTEEKERLLQQANMARSTLIKYEQHTNNIVNQLQTTQTENSHLKKELEALKKEMRQNNKNQNLNEIKLNRSLEEVERLKASLLQVKQEEKETKEFQRKKMEELSNAVKKLDRQRAELLNGFKKQLLIIDNLKRQKDIIAAGNLLKQAEDDFMNFLDCNPSSLRHAEGVKSAKT